MRVRITKEKIDDIADVIREKLGIEEEMLLSEMPNKIESIPILDVDSTKITAEQPDVAAGKIFYSSNGELVEGSAKVFNIDYIEGSLPSSSTWKHIIYGDKYIAIGGSNKVAYSTDGINWVENVRTETKDWYDITYGNGKYVGIIKNNSEKRVSIVSTDGINWNTLETTPPDYPYWSSVCFGNGKFVRVSDEYSTRAGYSTDGKNWTETVLPYEISWKKVFYVNNKFIAMGGGDKFAYSSDGINWNGANLPKYGSWSSIVYGKGIYIAVNGQYASREIIYSTDGMNWTLSSLPPVVYRLDKNCIAYGDGKFIIVDGYLNSNKALYSIDGLSWGVKTLPNNEYWGPITYGNEKFIIVSDGSNKILTI